MKKAVSFCLVILLLLNFGCTKKHKPTEQTAFGVNSFELFKENILKELSFPDDSQKYIDNLKKVERIGGNGFIRSYKNEKDSTNFTVLTDESDDVLAVAIEFTQQNQTAAYDLRRSSLLVIGNDREQSQADLSKGTETKNDYTSGNGYKIRIRHKSSKSLFLYVTDLGSNSNIEDIIPDNRDLGREAVLSTIQSELNGNLDGSWLLSSLSKSDSENISLWFQNDRQFEISFYLSAEKVSDDVFSLTLTIPTKGANAELGNNLLIGSLKSVSKDISDFSSEFEQIKVLPDQETFISPHGYSVKCTIGESYRTYYINVQ